MSYIQLSKTALLTGIIGLIVIAAIACFMLYLYILSIKAEREFFKKSHQFKKTYYLRVQGSLAYSHCYDFRSFDKGKNWYAVSGDEEQGMLILGMAEDVYPGVLKQHSINSQLAIKANQRQNSRLN